VKALCCGPFYFVQLVSRSSVPALGNMFSSFAMTCDLEVWLREFDLGCGLQKHFDCCEIEGYRGKGNDHGGYSVVLGIRHLHVHLHGQRVNIVENC
jgi:hypothetical protein